MAFWSPRAPGSAPVNRRDGAAVPQAALLTQQGLVSWLLERDGSHSHPIATDTFLGKSKDSYPSPWLSRELVQNFVDHNPTSPGTLDGVHIASKKLRDGTVQFTIQGNWPFQDNTGVLSPHSEKPGDINTAGGNGIGLKQTALRLLRDFDVTRFDIEGEEWTVKYKLAKAAELDAKRAQAAETDTRLTKDASRIRHDWLIGEVEATKQRGKNSYVIETKNPELIAALSDLSTAGVSKENPFLAEPDYENKHGKLKWLNPESGVTPRGRLYLNGQVMNYRDIDKSDPKKYWDGPEGVTVQLNDVKYQMSIDRPPVSPMMLGMYMDKFVGAMSKDDLIAQMKRSEHVWAGRGGLREDGYMQVLNRMTSALKWKDYKPSEWATHFPPAQFGKHVASDGNINQTQLEELRKQGYVICPSFFADIGMETATSKLGAVEAASNVRPDLSRHVVEQMAQQHGIEVEGAPYAQKESEAFLKAVLNDLGKYISGIEQSQTNPNVLRLRLNTDIPVELLSHRLPRPSSPEQNVLFAIRGMARHGLTEKWFNNIYSAQGGFVTTYATQHDRISNTTNLIARNTKSPGVNATFVEIELSENDRNTLLNLYHVPPAASGGNMPPHDAPGTADVEIPVGRPLPDTEGAPQKEAIEKGEWTPEDRTLYQAAFNKRPEARTPADLEALAKWERVKQKLKDIGISQPSGPQIEGKEARVVERTLLPEERERLKTMEKNIPGLATMVESLEGLVPEKAVKAPTGETAIEQYLAWRESADFYGTLGNNAQYLNGRSLMEIVAEHNEADIESVVSDGKLSPKEKTLSVLKDRLEKVVNRLMPEEHSVENFELIASPTERQLAQLGLLRHYAYITTGAALPNDLFLYDGSGTKGININKKAIGLHISHMDASFAEALGTLTHEIAHNKDMDHGPGFMHTMQALFMTMHEHLFALAKTLEAGKTVTPEEKALLDMQQQWNKLASGEAL